MESGNRDSGSQMYSHAKHGMGRLSPLSRSKPPTKPTGNAQPELVEVLSGASWLTQTFSEEKKLPRRAWMLGPDPNPSSVFFDSCSNLAFFFIGGSRLVCCCPTRRRLEHLPTNSTLYTSEQTSGKQVAKLGFLEGR